MKNPVVYILASKKNGTLYVGVTCNLAKRLFEHKEGLVKGFSLKYMCHNLVFCQQHPTMESAIFREKEIKRKSRSGKIQLIERDNKNWLDLTKKVLGLVD